MNNSANNDLRILKDDVEQLKTDMVQLKTDVMKMNSDMTQIKSLLENISNHIMNKEVNAPSSQPMYSTQSAVKRECMKRKTSNETCGRRTPLAFPTVPGLKDAAAKKSWRECLNLIMKKFGARSQEYTQLQYVIGYSDILGKAFEKGFTEVIKLFIQNYILVISPSYEDSKMLFLALQYNQRDIMSLLIEEGADINYKDPSGNTLLHLSSEKGYHDIVALLLEAGVDVNARNTRGETPLIIAAKKGHLLVVNVLLRNVYCNTEYKTFFESPNTYYAAVDWARHMRHKSVLKLLMSETSTDA